MLDISVGDRWAIIGATGSGKTVLSRELLKVYHRATGGRVPIAIIDSKVQGDFKEFEKHKNLTRVVEGNDPAKVVSGLWKRPFTIWRPEEDDKEMYDEYFKLIYYSARKKKTASIQFVDELSSITGQSGLPPRHYDILQKQGRGMHNGLISLTQSPSFVPSNLIRQATHMICMRINDEYDVKKLMKAMGSEIAAPPNHDYGFWYRNCTKPKQKSPAIYYSDMKEFIYG